MSTKIAVLNGFISISFVKKLYSLGRYERRLFFSCQNERDFCDLSLSREQVEELVLNLQKILSDNS